MPARLVVLASGAGTTLQAVLDACRTPAFGAEVVAVGNGKLLEEGDRAEINVKSGDRILFGKYSGSEIKLEGKEYLIISEKDVLAVMSDERVPAGV